MPFGTPRTDVRKALEEALASRKKVKIIGNALGRSLPTICYVASLLGELAEFTDALIFSNRSRKWVIVISHISSVSFDESDEPPPPQPDPDPVGGLPPTRGAPGKREPVPVEPELVNADSDSERRWGRR